MNTRIVLRTYCNPVPGHHRSAAILPLLELMTCSSTSRGASIGLRLVESHQLRKNGDPDASRLTRRSALLGTSACLPWAMSWLQDKEQHESTSVRLKGSAVELPCCLLDLEVQAGQQSLIDFPNGWHSDCHIYAPPNSGPAIPDDLGGVNITIETMQPSA